MIFKFVQSAKNVLLETVPSIKHISRVSTIEVLLEGPTVLFGFAAFSCPNVTPTPSPIVFFKIFST
jgi:hypothetical protein